MRLFVSTLAIAAMFFAASTASAVDLLVSGAPEGQVGEGDLITLDIRLTNPGGLSLFGLGASVHGYAGNAEFVSGQAVGTYLDAICVGPGTCFGGLNNLAGTANGSQRTLAESAIGANGPRVQFALSATTTGVPNTGVNDQGLDNVVGSTQFRVTLRILPGASDFTLFVDSSYQGDLVNLAGGETTEINGQSFLIVVPEPGTALLMGLGLAGLAAAGRRE